MKYFYTILFFIIGLLLVGCSRQSELNHVEVSSEDIKDYSNEELSPADFNEWIASASGHLEKYEENEKLEFKLRYIPAEYSAMLELHGEKYDKEKWDTLVNNYSNASLFRLQIKARNFNNEFIKIDNPEMSVYEERIKYYAFDMQKDISAVINDDTIPCTIYHFERNYGVSPYSIFMIGFDGLKIADDINIIIRERVFSDNKVEFDFSFNEIKNVPRLKF